MTIGGLEVMVAAPALGALAVVAMRGDSRRAAWTGLAVTSLVLAWSIGVWIDVVNGAAGYHVESDASWIDPIGVRWRLGVDALSAPLVVLTALLTWCCMVALLRRAPSSGGRGGLVALLLLIEAGSVGTFVALDTIVFFVFFELVLIPMWFVIAHWGDEHDPVGRRRAASRFLAVTVAGSAVMLVGFLLLRAETGTSDIEALGRLAPDIPHGQQALIAALLAVGFGAKAPMWPLHFWLPDAHSKAPTVGSVILAGVLLKLGTYGLIRFWYDTVPEGALDVAPYVAGLGVVGVVYGALACLAQRDLKRLIAFSSVGHMGFVLLAVATLTPQGRAGANFANVAHGAITGLLFFLVGALKDRVGSTDLAAIGRGIYARSPHLGALIGLAAMASLGLPGLAGFWGEMLALLAAFDPNPALPRPTFVTLMAIAGVGVVLTTLYFVRVVRQVCQGVPGDGPQAMDGVHVDEWVAWSPLAALAIGLGVVPSLMLWSAAQEPVVSTVVTVTQR
jgi:NADH-quinone oxidoreductase subunit M